MFSTLNLYRSALYFALSATLIFAPDIVYWLFGVNGDDSGDFIAKRAGMLFLGLALVCSLSRKTNDSDARIAISVGLAASMSGLALSGVYEFYRGYVGPGIWLAIAFETVFAASYVCVLVSEHRCQRNRTRQV